MNKDIYITNERLFYKSLTNTLKDVRKEKGISQKDVADVINVSEEEYAQYELAKISVPIPKLVNICNILGIDLSELIKSSIEDQNTEGITLYNTVIHNTNHYSRFLYGFFNADLSILRNKVLFLSIILCYIFIILVFIVL